MTHFLLYFTLFYFTLFYFTLPHLTSFLFNFIDLFLFCSILLYYILFCFFVLFLFLFSFSLQELLWQIYMFFAFKAHLLVKEKSGKGG